MKLEITKIIFGTLILCISGGCVKKKDDALTPVPPVKVGITVAGSGSTDVTGAREYSGTVAASATTTVSFSVAGTITSLTAEEGSRVSKGQVIGKISAGDYINADNIARAQLAEAEDAYARLKKLHDADALPDIKWVEIEQKLKQARNAAELSARTLADATLKSPVSGTVSQKFAGVGQNIIPGEPVYEIVSENDLLIEITVPENEIGSLKEGDRARITFNNPDLMPVEGKVTQKSVTANSLTRGFAVKISLPGDDSRILPGMIATVEMLKPTGHDTKPDNNEFVLPPQAIQLSEDNRNFVWITAGGKAERRFVTVDETAPGGVLVKSGLVAGDTVITEGMRKVSTGTPVICE